MIVGIDTRAAKWYRGTGIGTYTYQLINSINDVDSMNKYILFSSEDSILNLSLKNNFKLNNIAQENKTCFWDEVRIPNIIQGENIELYHVPQNGVGLPMDKKCPFIITLHDIIPLKKPDTVSERYLKVFNEDLPKLIPLCDGIITVSNHSKNDIKNAFNYPEEKIFVTYLAAEKIYRPLSKDLCKSLISKKYSIDDDFILYIGGFSPRKNIMSLIEAYSMLPQKVIATTSLVIAGSKGISFEKYKKRTEELKIENKVIFPGFIPLEDLPSFYNAAKVFVYPSFYEGFGLPPIEAMACGTPVIASNVTSIPEICENSCLLINPYDVIELKKAMINILSDNNLSNELIKKGFEKASSFNWNRTAINTIDAYNKVLGLL